MFNYRFKKRISVSTSAILSVALLAVIPISSSSATPLVSVDTTTNPTNTSADVGTLNGSLMTAAIIANSAVVAPLVSKSSGHATAASVGLVEQDAASGVSQTATVRASGVLSLYAKVSTPTAISATGGTFSSSAGIGIPTYNTATTSTLFPFTANIALGTGIATLWTAPATPGSYTISLTTADGTVALTPTVDSPTPNTAGASIVVTVIHATNAIHGTTISDTASNVRALIGVANQSLFTAVALSTSGSAVVSSATDVATAHLTAKSLGLLTKDSSVGTAQTATMLTSGVLSLYANVTTTVAFTSSGGTFGTTTKGAVPTYNQTRSTLLMTNTLLAAGTSVGVTWTAPSTAGTYTISMYYHGNGAVPTTATPAGTLSAQITVSVVAASAGGSYSAAYSVCNTSTGNALPTGTNVDSTSTVANGGSWYIAFALNDAYVVDLPAGNIVATATNGALLSFSDDGATAAAGTASTVVAYDEGNADSIRVVQATANAPISTTVTITYNGTTVCTKSVSIRGEVANVAVTVTDVQDLSANTGKADFLADGWANSARAGHFTVLATDSAGGQVATDSVGTFTVNAASLAGQTIVTALSVTSSATVTSSTSAGRISTGTYTCGATAGEVKTAKLDFTTTSTGKVTTSPAFTLRCADNPYSYTASWDKASYVQGELATLTVKFLDSKGFAANSTSDTGSWVGVTPMLTPVSATGAAGGLDKDGAKKFTYTVGTPSGLTAGTYVSVIDYTTLTGAGTAVVATPSYKVSTGGDTTSNADVLKSIVALIASINKQIQALQKLILKR